MIGDIVGMDGIGTERHGGQAVALEDTEVCVLPFDRLEELARHVLPLQHNLHKVLSTAIARDQNVMLLLGVVSQFECKRECGLFTGAVESRDGNPSKTPARPVPACQADRGYICGRGARR